MKSVANIVQINSRIISLKLLGATGTLSIGRGTPHITASRTSAGIYVVTFLNAFAQVPDIYPVAIMASTTVFFYANARLITATGFTLEVGSEAGAAADADVSILVVGTDSADES
jgi:hypothetical protein